MRMDALKQLQWVCLNSNDLDKIQAGFAALLDFSDPALQQNNKHKQRRLIMLFFDGHLAFWRLQ